MSPPYLAIAAEKQSQQRSRIPAAWQLSSLPPSTVSDVRSIPTTCGILSSHELRITQKYDATALAAAIAIRELKAYDVATAFCKRAAIAQQLTNCLTEIMFEEGMKRAAWLDAELERTGKVVGPLHGIPISVKDSFMVKGYDASIGIAAFANKVAETNSPLVDVLLAAGAVLYCKTNVPQTLMALDSHNHLFGRVLNPANRLVTAGGSSGGEGALIAMRGSVLGVGTDVGGSIRIPAMCNGIYGFKPSTGRIPYLGQTSGVKEGSEGISLRSCAGPLATSVRDVELFMKVVADASPWDLDPGVLPASWESTGSLSSARKPLIGIVRSDGINPPLPPISKVLDETAQALRNAGVDVIEMVVPELRNTQALANGFLNIDGNNSWFNILESTGEPLSPWLAERISRKPIQSLDKVLALHARKAQIEVEMLKIWKDSKSGRTIDAFICPIAAFPTPPVDRWVALNYTLAFNLLDWPAGVLPIRRVTKDDLLQDMSGEAIGTVDKLNRKLCML